MEGSASRQRHRGMAASYIPKAITLNGKSSMSRKRTNWVNCGSMGLADSLNRERERACGGADGAEITLIHPVSCMIWQKRNHDYTWV